MKLKDIAAKLGLHHGTVSRALRGDSRIAPATRQRVQAVALEMGYEPDASARAMAARRQAARPLSERGALAMLLPHESGTHPSSYFSGATQRASELGYTVNEIFYHTPGMTAHRVNQILKNRGIVGVLVQPDTASSKYLKRLQLDWSHFSSVIMGNGLFLPTLHRVADDQFRNLRLLTRKLGGLGYRRIGFFTEQKRIVQAENSWLGGYLAEMMRLKQAPMILNQKENQYDEKAIRRWIRDERLDAILTGNCYAVSRLQSVVSQKVPEDLGLAALYTETPEISGINHSLERIGAAAVDFIVHQIHTHQRGVPEFPQRILVQGIWNLGETVRKV